MNLLQKTGQWIKNNFTRSDLQIRADAPIKPTGLISIGGLNNLDAFAAALKNYTFVCINKRANAIAGLKWKFEYVSSKEPVEENHPLRILFEEPNAIQSKMEIFKLAQYWYDTTGNSLLQVVENQNKPIALWNIPIVNLQMNFQSGMLKSYSGSVGSSQVNIPAEEVIHFRHLIPGREPQDLFNGKSLVNRVIDLISTNEEMNKYLHKYFQNEGLPPVIAQIDPNLRNLYSDPAKIEELRDRWNARNPNNPLAGALMGVEIKPLNTSGVSSSESSAIPSLDKSIKETIAAVFGLPMGLITGDQQNRATAEVNERHFYQSNIEPLAKEYESKFNRYFKKYYPDVKITYESFDFSDKNLEIQKYNTYVQSGIMTKNEVRAELGLPPLEETKDDPEQLSFVQKVLGKKAASKFKDLSEEQKKSIWEYTVKQAEKHEKRYVKLIGMYFKDLNKEIVRNVNNHLNKNIKNNSEITADFNLFDIEQWNAILSNLFSPSVRQQIIADMLLAFEQVSINYDNIESDFDVEIKVSTNEVIGRIKTINDTVDKEIKEQIRLLIQDNLNLQPNKLAELLTDKIDEEFMNRYKNRSQTIARTTTTQARGEAKTTAWDSTDAEIRFVWLSERDGKVRDSHRKADGQEIKNGEYFKVGKDKMPYPAGGSVAEENINCRCDVFPEIIE